MIHKLGPGGCSEQERLKTCIIVFCNSPGFCNGMLGAKKLHRFQEISHDCDKCIVGLNSARLSNHLKFVSCSSFLFLNKRGNIPKMAFLFQKPNYSGS